MARKQLQSGAVSIFAVMFSALLLTVLTIGFIKLVVSDQQQASNNDLSQSAYDSALAGVEDAKRLIKASIDGRPNAVMALANFSDDCRVIARGGVNGNHDDAETMVQTKTGVGGGSNYNQAYSCVKVNMLTDDYLYRSTEGSTQLVPIKAQQEFTKVVIDWYDQEDVSQSESPTAPAASNGLTAKAKWGDRTPPLMRVQLITPGADFNLTSLDSSAASQTVIMRPSELVSGQPDNQVSLSPSVRARAVDEGQFDNSTDNIACSKEFAFSASYSCRAVLDLDRTLTPEESANAFLRINTIYKGASVRVQLLAADGSVVKFDGVQPVVDSTGRAANLYRRVEARLKIGSDFPYPDGAVDVVNSLCKNFAVIDDSAIYGESPHCNP